MSVSDVDWPVVGAGTAVEHDERVRLRLGGGGVWGEGGGEPPAFVLQVVALVLKVGDFMSDDYDIRKILLYPNAWIDE